MAALLPLAVLTAPLATPTARAQALFNAVEVDQSKFVVVAAPIGDGSRSQLNIYEQRSAARPCFAVQGANPAQVDPLLSSFDFTGICNRFIDANGYSVRVGATDLATVYRLSVLKENGDTLLMALPTKPGVGPDMVVARSGGSGSGFLLLVPEPGWTIKRRAFAGRTLGHVYLQRDSWPEAPGATATSPASSPAVAPALPAVGSASSPAKP